MIFGLTIYHHLIISYAFQKHELYLNISTIILLILSIYHRFIGLENIEIESALIIQLMQIVVGSFVFFYCRQQLVNLNLDLIIEANKSQSVQNVNRGHQVELQEIFESLREGIVVIQDGAISFKNSIFESICNNNIGNLLDLKLFKVYRKNQSPQTERQFISSV